MICNGFVYNCFRGLEFVCTLFRTITEDYKSGNMSENLGALTRQAYEQSLKKFHGWLLQKMISVSDLSLL